MLIISMRSIGAKLTVNARAGAYCNRVIGDLMRINPANQRATATPGKLQTLGMRGNLLILVSFHCVLRRLLPFFVIYPVGNAIGFYR